MNALRPRRPLPENMELNGLIAGLGNPGPRYRDTRHNFGFMLADALAHAAQDSRTLRMGKGTDKLCELQRIAMPDGKTHWLVCKPLTYMNESGRAVARVSQYFKVPPEDIMVLHDELDLPLGRMKFKRGGGTAGHNGLKSIAQHLGTKDFLRLRLGVGKPQYPGQAPSDHVLSPFTPAERELVHAVVDAAIQGLRLYCDQGFVAAQQFLNGFAPPISGE